MTRLAAQNNTLFLVGSGAVQGAWRPVISALRRIGFDDLATADGAAFAMARLVYLARLARLRADSAIGKHQDKFIQKLAEARDLIGEKLIEAEKRGELVIRPEFEQVLRSFLPPPGSRALLITTNWDSVVEKAAKSVSPGIETYYVHGRATDARHLYLPTEIVEEPFREKSELDHLNNARANLVRAIENTTTLVIYGLAVSALDVELGQVIGSGILDGRVREIHVVNPNYIEVAERLATFEQAGTQERPIYCQTPENLDRRWLFAVADVEGERSRIQDHLSG